MDWLRWHHGTVESGKWRAIARRSGQPVHAVVAVWALLSEYASRSRTRGIVEGWDDEAASAALDMEPEHVAAIREAMQGRTLDGWRLTSWEEEQVKREREDSSTERVRALRERKRQPEPDKTKGERVTPRNATKHPEERRGEEIEREKEILPPTGEESPRGAASAPDAGDNLLGWWIKREERKTGIRPPDSEIGKQSAAAKAICGERTTEHIRRAVQGMDRVYPYNSGTPWHLTDLRKHFQTALTIPLTEANGNGRSNGRGRNDWQYRQPGESAEDDPIFQSG